MKNIRLFSVLFFVLSALSRHTYVMAFETLSPEELTELTSYWSENFSGQLPSAENQDIKVSDISSGIPVNGIHDSELFGAHTKPADLPLTLPSTLPSTPQVPNSGAFSGGPGDNNTRQADSIKKNTCPYCNKHHLRTHTGEQPFACNLCGKQFNDRSSCRRHIRAHSGEKPFGCQACKKRFNRKDSLKQHLRICIGEKQFVCMACGKLFTQESNLTNHRHGHTGEISFECEVNSVLPTGI